MTYTLTYANTSSVNASGVVIRDPLPSGTTFVSATNGGTVSNGVVVFNIGTVNANTSGKVSFTVRVTAPEGATVTNTGYTIEATDVAPVTGSNVVTSATAASKIFGPWVKAAPTAPADTSDFCPDCGGEVAGDSGVGAKDGDPVNLSSGQESYQPAADLMAYNPSGLNAAWQRAFSTEQSLRGYGTPGLAPGWTSNADVYVTTTPGDWGALSLHYPNGSVENLSPDLDPNGQPTGYFATTKNPPYVVTGVPGGNAGTWSYLVVTWKQGAQWNFTPLGGTNGTYVLDRIISKTGQVNAFTWDASRRLQRVQDVSSGMTLLTFAYNNSGYLSSVTDVYGRQIVYTFATPDSGNPSGIQLTQVSQIVAAGTTNPPMRSSYDYTGYTNPANGSVAALLASISVPSASGSGIATARITYDAQGRVSSNIDANGNIRAYTYNAGSTLVENKDPQGNVVLSYTQNFDAKGRETGTTDSAGNSTLIKYEDVNNPYQATSVTDEMGRTTTMTYDGFGNVVTSTSPRHITTSYTYDYSSFAPGRLVQVQEAGKPPVSMTYYEPAGLPQSITAPSPTGSGTITATYAYDALGNVLTVTTPGITASSTRTTSFNYTQDGTYSQVAKAGQPLSVTDTLGQTTHLRYDARGNVTSSWDALGNTSDIAYNLADQPTDTYAPATGQTGSGRTHTNVTYLYPGGPSTTSRLYDESGGLFRTVVSYYGPEGETLGSSGDTTASSVTYDALYRTKTLRDASNNVTSYFYDTLGNVSQIVYPGADGSGKDTVNFTAYDADGQLRQRIDGRGHVTNYTYNDAEGQLTGVSYPYSSGENISYSYDAYGLPQSVADASGTRSYTLNASDVLAQVSTVFKKLDGTLTSAKNISYTYNADGSRASMTTPAGTFAYGYDDGGRWTGLRDHQGNATSWNYDALNRMTHQQLNSGAQTNYSYNALSQLVGLSNLGSNGGLLSRFGHESDPSQMLLHDAAGNLTREVASFDPYSSSRFFIGTTNYSYDNKDQLLNETSTRYSPRNDQFGYDERGNPISWKGSTRAFNANNQETTGGTSQFSYDGNGNATNYKGNTLTYDEENHMTSFTTASGATPLRATYRSDGLRGWKQVASGNRYFFLYDGDQIVCGFNGNGDLSRINVWGASGLIGRQSGTNGGTPVYDYAWDDRGNISQVLNTNSSVASNYLVSAWGEASTDSAAYDPYRCMGGQLGNYFDAETGLILCGQRYYDPSGGRWINRDPISYAGGLNVYGYCGNNPTNFADPSGLSPNKSLSVYGGDQGPDVSMYSGTYGFLKPELTYVDNEMYKPSHRDFVTRLLRADSFYFWGHGSNQKPGEIKLNDQTVNRKYVGWLDLSTIRWIAKTRRSWGIPKMKFVTLDACFTASKAAYVNAWLQMADEFTGYEGETWYSFNGLNGRGKQLSTRTPMKYNPGAAVAFKKR